VATGLLQEDGEGEDIGRQTHGEGQDVDGEDQHGGWTATLGRCADPQVVWAWT